MNLPMFTIMLAFITANATKFSVGLQELIANNNVSVDDQVLFVKKNITSASGNKDIIDANTKRLTGVCNYDTNKLQSGRAFIFDKVSVLYATHADALKEGALAYNTVAPAELLNAELVITQNGRVVLHLPVRDLANVSSATANTTNDSYIQLNSLRYLKDEDVIDMQLRFPDGVAISGTNNHYVCIALKGAQTTKKA